MTLVEVGTDLLPEWQFEVGTPETSDVVVTLGQPSIGTSAELYYYLNASRWAGEISFEPFDTLTVDSSPFGGLAAAGLVAAEAFKSSMRKLKAYATMPIYDDLFAPTPSAVLPLAPERTPVPSRLGRVDCISGGALINSTIFALARIPGVTGQFRVIEPDNGDTTNLHRYMLMRRSRCEMRKAYDLQSQALGRLNIEGLPLRYDADTRVGNLAPNVLVGVDHIPSRWAAQQANPEWMAIAATQGFEVMTTFHKDGLACAGCAHPEYSPPDGPIPTVAFVSFISGLLMAAMLAERVPLGNISDDRQLTWFAPLQAGQAPNRSVLPVYPAYPIHRTSDLAKIMIYAGRAL